MTDRQQPTRPKAQQVVDDYLEAYKACRQAIFYCLGKGEGFVKASLIQRLHDAEELSLTAANFLMRGSRHHRPLMRLACDVLQSCAETIEGADHEDDQLEVAYVACLRARKACLEMLDPEHGPDQRKQDKTLEDTFPASDPAPSPTEI